MTDTAQERVEDGDRLVSIERAVLVLQKEGYPDLSAAVQNRILEDAAKVRLLRARQREEGGGLERIEARLDELESYAHGESFSMRYTEGYQHGFLRALRHVRTELDAMAATPQQEGADPLVPGLCPHCSGLMGHYGDCPHGPQREGEREPRCPDCGGRLALVTGEYRLASGELVGRSDWWKCPECSEGDPDEALRAALDTEPPAEREPDHGPCENHPDRPAVGTTLDGVGLCEKCAPLDELAEPSADTEEGEREPTRRDLFRALLGLWRTADGCPHCCNRREVEDAFNVLVRGRNAGLAEPPAEPDLDELTPRCPVCEETMHDCECNPYMGSEEEDDE